MKIFQLKVGANLLKHNISINHITSMKKDYCSHESNIKLVQC